MHGDGYNHQNRTRILHILICRLPKAKIIYFKCIIDFNINDFENIKNGGNFLQIIEDKILSLKNDTNYAYFVSEHESAEKILKLQNV